MKPTSGTETVAVSPSSFDWETLKAAYHGRHPQLISEVSLAFEVLANSVAELKELPFRLDDTVEEITKAVDSGDLAQVCTKLVQVRMEITRQAAAIHNAAETLAITIRTKPKSGEDA